MKSTSPKFLVLIICFAAIASLRADIIPSLGNISPSGSNFQWNYNVNVTVDQQIRTGDYFTIFDFGSIIPNSAMAPAGWVFSTALLGITPSTVLPDDDANVLNLTWTYMGTTPISGSALVGIFSAITTSDQIRSDNFAARATLISGPQAGSKVDNIGMVAVPVPEVSALAPILALGGAIALSTLLPRWRRRRSMASV